MYTIERIDYVYITETLLARFENFFEAEMRNHGVYIV